MNYGLNLRRGYILALCGVLVLVGSAAAAPEPGRVLCGKKKLQEAAKLLKCRQEADAKHGVSQNEARRDEQHARCGKRLRERFASLEEKFPQTGPLEDRCEVYGDADNVVAFGAAVTDLVTEGQASALGADAIGNCSPADSCCFDEIPNRGMQAPFREVVVGKTAEECEELCCELDWCKSFDAFYTGDPTTQGCLLRDQTASEAGGLGSIAVNGYPADYHEKTACRIPHPGECTPTDSYLASTIHVCDPVNLPALVLPLADPDSDHWIFRYRASEPVGDGTAWPWDTIVEFTDDTVGGAVVLGPCILRRCEDTDLDALSDAGQDKIPCADRAGQNPLNAENMYCFGQTSWRYSDPSTPCSYVKMRRLECS